MSALSWDEITRRRFESGLDRGVFYMPLGDTYPNGVAWNGLTDLSEKPNGGTVTAYYAEGIKFAQAAAQTDFAASLTAITYPEELEEYEGTYTYVSGILVADQPKKPFGMSYRTRIGDPLQGFDLGYKLHLIYGVLATPTDKVRSTLSDNPEATPFGWDLTAKPVPVPGMKPSAHLILNSTMLDPDVLDAIELILYGSEGVNPRLPLPEEIFAITPTVPGIGSRFIIVIAEPDESLLPADALPGDAVITESELELYSLDDTLSEDVRPVFSVSNIGETLPAITLPGDVVYDESTGDLYQLGE